MEENEKVSLLSKELDTNDEMPFKYRIFNFYYYSLRKKSINIILLTFFMLFETIELVSYAFIDVFRPLWKVTDNSMNMIQLILGATRVTSLMKYLTFNQYFIIFVILISFIFLNFLLVAMTLRFNKIDSSLYKFCVSFTSYITANLCVFFLIPVSEVMLLIVKCNKDNQVDIVKESVKCFEGLHILYVFLGIAMMILFLCLIIINVIFNFNPFNSNKPTTIINPTADTFLVLFKIVLVILYIALENDWISILIMVLGSLLNLKNAWEHPTYNSYFLQCMVSMRNGSVFWTFLVLLICRIVSSTSFNGFIYLLAFGYPLIFITSILYYRYLRQEFCDGKSNFKNANEFLFRVNYFKKLIDSFIMKNKNNKNVNSFNALKKNEILLRGQIAIHEESCTNEECPLKKFLENQNNFAVQKTSLLHYMNILFTDAIKKFPNSQLILMTFVQYNYDKKYNLNAAKMHLSKLEKFKNNLTEDYIIFFIKKSVSMISNKFGEDEMIKIEDTAEHKLKRFKLLIDAATKLYGEFWGNLATNLTNNLNLNKLLFVGNRLNEYIHELNILWDEFKTKKIEIEYQNTVQLYYLFQKEIIKNKTKAEEILKKLNEEQNFEVHKTEGDKVDMNNLETILENQDYILYCRSNDMGNCTTIQCSNSIISLLGYQKSEIIGKKIEMLMPMLFQSDHGRMLGGRLKAMRAMINANSKNTSKNREKKSFFLLMKNKVGYLSALNSKFSIYNDDDFSNTFIIKARLEAKDPKVVYASYVLTKSDFTIDSISSSAINLGLTMDLLKKHLINLNNLIRSSDNEAMNVNEHIIELEEEAQKITWVLPDLVYPKTDNNNNNAELDFDKLIEDSKKKSMLLSISQFKYHEEVFGFCFKFTECELKKMEDIDINGVQEYTKKLMLYDVNKLNYIRAEIVKEKAKEEINPSNDEKNVLVAKFGSDPNKNGTKAFTEEDEEELINSDSNDNQTKLVENILTRNKIQELQVKGSEEIGAFIKILPFYGKEIFLKKKLPNKEENNAGMGIAPNIYVNLDEFVKRIEKSKNLDKRQILPPPEDRIASLETNSTDPAFISSSTSSLNNLFSKSSINKIRILSLSHFIILSATLSVEFAISFTKFNNLRARVFYSEKAFSILSSLLYTKYFITEAVLAQDPSIYNVPDRAYVSHEAYILNMLANLGSFRQNISDGIAVFNNATVTFSPEYINLTTKTQIQLYTLTNGELVQEHQPFWTAMNRIPTTIFYVSTVTNNYQTVTMKERNTFELMMNLLNDYYVNWKSVTMILINDIISNCEMSIILTVVFGLSFVITVAFSLLAWRTFSQFLRDGTRPVDLIMTIKKTKFEELKGACETFLNRLLNKYFGNEEIEDDNQNEISYSVASEDIVISKFKQKNSYNQSIRSNKQFLTIFLGIMLNFLFLQAYFIFKYLFESSSLLEIRRYTDIHNATYYGESDLLASYNVAKSFFFGLHTNKEIPIFNSDKPDQEFKKTLANLTDSIENLIKLTYSNMNYLSNSYISDFYTLLNEDIESVVTMELKAGDFLGTAAFGFKPLILRYCELIRFLGLEYFQGKGYDYINNSDYGEAGLMIRYVIQPWYQRLTQKLKKQFDDYVNQLDLIIASLFIVFLIIEILVYALIWKNIENKLDSYLKSSLDLINLIPEEIKYQMIIKINEEEQNNNKES